MSNDTLPVDPKEVAVARTQAQKELANFLAQIASAKKTISELAGTTNSLELAKQEVEERIEKLNASVTEIHGVIAALKDEQAKADADLAGVKEAYADAENVLAVLSGTRDKLQEEVLNLEAIVDDAKRESNAEIEEGRKSVQKELDEKCAERDAAEAARADAVALRDKALSNYKQALANREEINLEIETLKASYAEEKAIIDGFKAQKAELEAQIADLEKVVAKGKKDLAKAREALVEMNGQVDASREARDSIKKEIKTLQGELDGWKDQKFAFLELKGGLDQREAYIKKKYEDAGVPWEPVR